MSKALNLYRLQQIDSRLMQIEARIGAIQKTFESDEELRTARQQAEKSREELTSAEKSLKQAELDVSNQRIKLEQTEASLYGGRIQNPKELQDLQNDVASLKRHLSALEDRQLDAMMALETAQAADKESVSKFATIQAKSSAQNKNLMDELDQFTKESERLRTEREAAAHTIDAASLALYDEIRAGRRGVAVTTVNEHGCNACGSVLTPSQRQSAFHSTEIVRCTTCGRILFGK